MAQPQSKLKVAIVGGGLLGIMLLNTLSKHEHLDVNLYEASASISERGASVGLCVNAQRALEMLGLKDLLQSSGAVKVPGTSFYIGAGPHAGEFAFLNSGGGTFTVHRGRFLQELLSSVSNDNIHVQKRLKNITEEDSSSVTLKFEDGSETVVDVVIGADGIHSTVRSSILGFDDPGLSPVFAGLWDCRALIPAAEGVEKIGAKYINLEAPSQHAWFGNGAIIFSDIIDDGKTVCLVGGGRIEREWDKTQWKKEVDQEFLGSAFQQFGELGSIFTDLLLENADFKVAFVEWESGMASTYSKGTICMAGDAAHAPTPYQGAGLGQCTEDAVILGAILGASRSRADVVAGFQAYDRVRRPRTQRVITSSRETAFMAMGSHGLDPKVLAEIMPPRWRFIWDIDLHEHIADALKIMDDLRSK